MPPETLDLFHSHIDVLIKHLNTIPELSKDQVNYAKQRFNDPTNQLEKRKYFKIQFPKYANGKHFPIEIFTCNHSVYSF